jgi:hypothetical protein
MSKIAELRSPAFHEPGMAGPRRPISQVQALLKTTALEAGLMSRICVRRPHFALRELHWHADNFEATAVAELGAWGAWGEVGPMPAAELGRHGMMAGVCAAAMSQPDGARRCYLPRRACYIGFPSLMPRGTPVRFRSTAVAPEERTARSLVEAYTGDARQEQLMLLEVEYAVLPAHAFERLCRALGQVSPISLAEVLARLTGLAGEIFGRPYWILSATIDATRLCWAGERLHLEARRTAGLSPTMPSPFSCIASVDERPIARVGLTLTGTETAAEK